MGLTVTGTNFGSITVNSRTLTVVDHTGIPAVIVDNDVEDIIISDIGLQGPAGPAGPPGTSTSDYYTHVQSVASTTWTINHTVPFRPNVTLVDGAGRVILADVDYVSATQIVVTHSEPFSGTAYLS